MRRIGPYSGLEFQIRRQILQRADFYSSYFTRGLKLHVVNAQIDYLRYSVGVWLNSFTKAREK